MEEVTILVHGTFANPGYASSESEAPARQPVPGEEGEERRPAGRWWRLPGKGGEPGNIADRLQQRLRNLWEPGRDPRDGDLSYRDLGEWSGENTHKARMQAARKLAWSLRLLADGRGCRPDTPLLVNFVAHSHGGNVVLESLKRLSDNVKPRQVCLLGTPLTWRFPDLRIAYLPALAWFLWEALKIYRVDLAPRLAELAALSWAGSAVPYIGYALFLPILLWTGVLAITLSRGSSRWFRGQPAYGPQPEVLEREVGGRPVVLYISREDEADLMLQLGAAPLDTYRAMVAGRPTLRGVESIPKALLVLVGKAIEFFYVRPLSYVVVVPGMEILLEKVALGFPAWRVLLSNFEMVTWVGEPTYQDTQILTRPVPVAALQKRELRELKVELTKDQISVIKERRRGIEQRQGRIHALRATVFGTLKGLKKQVHLRHSGYYESTDIIRDVADTIEAKRLSPEIQTLWLQRPFRASPDSIRGISVRARSGDGSRSAVVR